jgi:hypothetical protein
MLLQGKLYAHSGSDFQFFAVRLAAGAPREPFLQKCDERRNRGGSRSGDSGLGSGFARNTGYAPVNHLDFAFNALNIGLSNHAENGMAFPLAELALGQGFTFGSGELHATGMDGVRLHRGHLGYVDTANREGAEIDQGVLAGARQP